MNSIDTDLSTDCRFCILSAVHQQTRPSPAPFAGLKAEYRSYKGIIVSERPHGFTRTQSPSKISVVGMSLMEDECGAVCLRDVWNSCL